MGANLYSMGGHGWAHVMLWVGMVVVDGYGLGMGTNLKEKMLGFATHT
jgi:hypothetical protein